MSDHSGLRYLFDQPNLNPRKDRLFAMISEFDFEISYIKDKEKKVAYALSKRIQENHIASMSSYGIDLRDGSYGQDNTMTSIWSLCIGYSRLQVIRMLTIVS